MAIDLISRKEWGARSPKGAYSPMPAKARGVKIHYTGGYVSPKTLSDHDYCVRAVRDIQRMHMDGNGWLDIGYSFVACPHRKVFVGRGLGHLPAANGPGLNSQHYAVLVLVGSSGVTQPTDGHLHAARDAIDYIRASGRAGNEIKGHRDGYPTECPGDPLYAWVRKGAPRPSAKPEPTPEPEPEEDMPEIVSLGLKDEVTVPAGTDYQPWWTTEWKDSAGWHPAGGQSIAPSVDVWADITTHISLRGLQPGEPVTVGLTRHTKDGTLVDVAWPIGKPAVFHADAGGRVEANLNGHFKLGKDTRARVTIRHTSANTVYLETSSAFKALLYRYRS